MSCRRVGRRKLCQVFIHLQGLGSSQLANHLVNEINQGPYYVKNCGIWNLVGSFRRIFFSFSALTNSEILEGCQEIISISFRAYCNQKIFHLIITQWYYSLQESESNHRGTSLTSIDHGHFTLMPYILKGSTANSILQDLPKNHFKCLTKGQLISKAIFVFLTSPKKRTKTI